MAIICIAANSCIFNKSGQKDENDLSSLNLKGDVRLLTETMNITNSIDEKAVNKQIHLFDKKGKLIEEDYYRKDTLLSSKIVYKYDGYGNLVEKRIMDDAGNTDSKTIYKYDENNRLYQKLDLNHLSMLVYRETYKYDRNHYEVERFIYRPSQSEWNIIMTSDDNGNLKKESFNTIIGGSVIKIVYTNDKKGNKLEEKYFKNNGSIGTRYTHKYDKNGNLTETVIYSPDDKIISSTLFRYDNKLKQVETYYGVSETNPEPDQIQNFDEHGNLTEEIIKNGLATSRKKCEYLYDERGNWIKKTITVYQAQSEEVASVSSFSRIIEYF